METFRWRRYADGFQHRLTALQRRGLQIFSWIRRGSMSMLENAQ